MLNLALNTITDVTGLDPGWEFNLGLYGGNYPPEWTELEPIENETNDPIKYFELNTTTGPHAGGNYTLYFNLTLNVLGSINPDNVSLFVYETNWTELNTWVLDDTSDPVRFCSNLTHFSKFLIGEIAPPEEPPSYPPAPGGRHTPKKNYSFALNKDTIKVFVRQGETKKGLIEVENNGEETLNIEVDSTGLEGFVTFQEGVEEYSFSLKPGEKEIIQLTFTISADQKPDVYFGKIIVRSDDLESVITTIVEVESAGAVFDVEIEIPGRFIVVEAGEDLTAEITLINLEEAGPVDVVINYFIKDIEGNTIIEENETVRVETKVIFLRSFNIPSYVNSGDYVLYANVDLDGVVASSSHLFKVTKEPHLEVPIKIPFPILVSSILGLAIIIAVFLLYKHKKESRKHSGKKKKRSSQEMEKFK